MKILSIIPARGGSKSIPKKNIYPFSGKPLIAYSIEHAIKSPSIDRVIVSTDSKEIAKIAKSFGAEVPFIRPDELGEDDTPDLPVFIHCLNWLKENKLYEPDIIVHLRPTSPLRTVSMIEDAINLLKENPHADSVRTGCEPTQNPFKMWTIGQDGLLKPLIHTDIPEQWNQPRQKLPKVFWQNGYVDVTRFNTIMNKNSMTGEIILPLLVKGLQIIDIDDKITLKLAENIFREQDK